MQIACISTNTYILTYSVNNKSFITNNSYIVHGQTSLIRTSPWFIGNSKSTVYMDTKQNNLIRACVHAPSCSSESINWLCAELSNCPKIVEEFTLLSPCWKQTCCLHRSRLVPCILFPPFCLLMLFFFRKKCLTAAKSSNRLYIEHSKFLPLLWLFVST